MKCATRLGLVLPLVWAAQSAAAGAAAWGGEAGRLGGGDRVHCLVRSILGEDKPGGFDGQLSTLKKQLSKPPFSPYKSLRLLETHSLELGRGAREQLELPTGKLLKLRFREKLLVREMVRLRMYLSIAPPKDKDLLPGTIFTIEEGGTLMVAGDRHQNGTLIVGITCQSR